MSLAPLLAVTIALFAVLRFWTYRPRTGGVIRPGARFGQRRWAGINAIGTVKRSVVLPIAKLVQRLHPLVSRNAFQGWGSVVIKGFSASRSIAAETAANRTLLIVSEVRLLREGIAKSIEGNSGLLVAGTCEKLTQIFAALHEYPGATVVLDAAFPNGFEALKAIRAADSSARVVVFAVSETEENVVAWARAETAGYIPRTAALRELVQFIESIDRGDKSARPR